MQMTPLLTMNFLMAKPLILMVINPIRKIRKVAPEGLGNLLKVAE